MGSDRTRDLGPTIATVAELFSKSPEQEGQDRAAAELRRQQRRADTLAAEMLAARDCPADLVEWGRLHGIPTFAAVTWQAGFRAGMRAAMEEVERRNREAPR